MRILTVVSLVLEAARRQLGVADTHTSSTLFAVASKLLADSQAVPPAARDRARLELYRQLIGCSTVRNPSALPPSPWTRAPTRRPQHPRFGFR